MSKKSGDDEEATPPPPSSGGIRSSEDLDEQQMDSASAPNISSASIDSTTEAAAAAAGKPEEIQDDSAACPVPFNSAIFEDDEAAKKRAPAAAAAAVVGAQLSSTEGREDNMAHPTIFEDDNVHPMPLHSMEDDEGAEKRAATATPLYAEGEGEVDGPTLLEVEDDGYHPVPFNSADFEDDEQVKRRAAAAMAPLSSPAVINNEMTATVNETYDEEEALGIDTEGDALEIDNGQEDADSLQQGNQQSSSNFGMVDLDSSVAVIPHAYLVEDDDDDNIVIARYAEPIPPWWKQRRMRGMLALIFLVLLTAAIAIGVLVSRRDSSNVGAAAFRTGSSTQSNAPSSPPSEAPTISFAPSSSPSSCSDTIVSNTKEVNIDIFVGGLKEPKVAIDGNNMVVVARDSTGYIYVIFYKKSIDGEFARARYFVEECQRSTDPKWTGLNDYNCFYSVSFSGSTALVGLQSERHTSEVATPVAVFEQTGLGQWGKVESLSPPSEIGWRNFGYSVGIDGDLACLLGVGSDTSSPGSPTLVIFRKVSGGWEQLHHDSVSTSHSNGFTKCEVSGSTIMAFATRKKMLYYYVFDRATGSIQRIQNDSGLGEVFEGNSLDGDVRSFDGNYLVLSEPKDVWNVDWQLVRRDYTVYIYRRDKENEPFLLRQRLMDYDYEEGFGRTLNVHDDTLVVGGNNRTFVFMDHGDFFEESITLEKAYTSIEVFNRQVIATTEDNRVEAFVISEDCTQLVPTQTPSLSSAPSVTQFPSTLPSQSPIQRGSYLLPPGWRTETMPPTMSPSERADPGKPSSSPSLSYTPTEKCFVIRISFDYDDYPTETIWTLTQVGVNGEDGNVIKSYHPQLKEDQSHVESICLKEGRYHFVVSDWDGICCDHGLGHYNVTSYGQTIVQGGKFERGEARIFDLPYDSNSSPSQSPSVSSAPSQSTFECFATGDELKSAVYQYVRFRCVLHPTFGIDECRSIISKYGWPMNSWCVGNVTDMSGLFREMRTFNDDVSLWDVSKVQDMRSMFDGASSFNEDLSLWNVSQVQDMSDMFNDASSFNGDVSLWDVSQVQDMSGMFYYASSFNGNLSSWNVSQVQDMSWMFGDASSFNGDVSLWDVSKVQDMSWMFSGASSFNGDVSLWNVSEVQDMYGMFDDASSFNQDLCEWADKNFPFAYAFNIFGNSGCTYQSTPQIEQGGPFCASFCTFTPSTTSLPPTITPQDSRYCENACVDEVECQEMCAEIELEWGWTADEQNDFTMPHAGCFVTGSRCFFGNFEGGEYEFDEIFETGRTVRLCYDIFN